MPNINSLKSPLKTFSSNILLANNIIQKFKKKKSQKSQKSKKKFAVESK